MANELSRVKIIGTSHIAKESVAEIERYVEDHDVDVMCVELDKERLYGLQHNVQNRISLKNIGLVRQIGFAGFLFALVASYVQRKLGKKVKLTPGADMLAAVKTAAKHDIKVALIDQNINVTLQKLSKSLPFREKWRMFADLFKGMLGFKSELSQASLQDIELDKVPSSQLIDIILEKTKDRYPVFYDVLVHQRNVYMAKRLISLLENHPDWHIVAVVGAGHKQGMIETLESHFSQTYTASGKQKMKHEQLVYTSSFDAE